MFTLNIFFGQNIHYVFFYLYCPSLVEIGPTNFIFNLRFKSTFFIILKFYIPTQLLKGKFFFFWKCYYAWTRLWNL